MKKANLMILLSAVTIILLLIGGVMSMINEWKWFSSDAPVKASERWDFFLSGPVYFIVPGVILHIVYILLDRKN
jgi:heme/copper-type cytochrome/quinol oxidase subunit 2